MATIQRRGKKWRVQLYVKGQRDSGTFNSKAEAAAWALEREANLSGRKLPRKTFGDAMARYARDVSPLKPGSRWELTRLNAMQADPVAACALPALTPSDLVEYRDRRLGVVSGATVRREFSLIGVVLETARREWGWLRVNPAREVRRPTSPPARRRRVTAEEIRRLSLAFGISEGLASDTAMQRTGLAFLFALETAMRAGEIVGLTAEHVHIDERYVRLPRTKNGDVRDVPLSKRAIEILETLPANAVPVFGLEPGTRDVFFRRARDAAGIPDLHFHDARAEAIWRLSKKLDVLQLARMIGHRDPKSLMFYYAESPQETAAKLD